MGQQPLQCLLLHPQRTDRIADQQAYFTVCHLHTEPLTLPAEFQHFHMIVFEDHSHQKHLGPCSKPVVQGGLLRPEGNPCKSFPCLTAFDGVGGSGSGMQKGRGMGFEGALGHLNPLQHGWGGIVLDLSQTPLGVSSKPPVPGWVSSPTAVPKMQHPQVILRA